MSATVTNTTRRNRKTATDEDLEHRIANYLFMQKVPHNDQVRADAHLGTVVISGKLESNSEKWRCLETCRRVAGVIRLIDRIVVQSASGTRKVGSGKRRVMRRKSKAKRLQLTANC